MEQTSIPSLNVYQARRSDWTWEKLKTDSYRPIRRNNIDADYVFATKWGSRGTGNGQFNYPNGIDVDSAGNVYVADTLNHRIQKFTNAGGFITIWGTGNCGCGNSQFCAPQDVASDKSGNIYVVDSDNIYCSPHVRKFNNSGSFITKWGSNGTGNGQFEGDINGVAVDSSGNVYVTDSHNNRVQKFTNSGSFITKWGSNGTGNGQFEGDINGVAVDSSGNVYVTDSHNNRVQKFTNSGSFITKWGSWGTGNGQFSVPFGIAADIFGNVYVSDLNNHRIQKFSSAGSFITKWGACCSPDGFFYYPAGVAVDSSGNVYVADIMNNRIQKFDSSGNFLTKWGSFGTENGEFQYPDGVAVDSSGYVYVADSGNDRIQKFTPVSPQPSAPSNLTATAVSSSQINLSWTDNSNNETGFKIKRKTGVNGTYSTIATVGANVTSYSNTGLTGGGTYYYAVWAYNSNGDSACSNEVSATVVPSGPPAAPSNLTAGIGYCCNGCGVICLTPGKGIILTWTDNSNNETGFKIECKTGTSGTYSEIRTAGANTTSCGDNCGRLKATGVTYCYRVRAYNASGNSAYSNEACVTVP
jgi:sugar lactone lactonase YvrE